MQIVKDYRENKELYSIFGCDRWKSGRKCFG